MRRLALPLACLCGLALAVVPALAADQTVTTVGDTFSPDEVGVTPGDTVTIHNGGGGLHDLNWADGEPGQPLENTTDWSTQRTFSANGEYVFYCDVHGSATSGMRGVVHVNSAGTVPSGGGGTTTTSTTPPPAGTTTSESPPPPGGTTTTTNTTTTATPVADTIPPRATRLRARATRRGLRVRLRLSEPARVVLRLVRRGRRVARRTYRADAGRVRLRVRRALRPGRYRVRLRFVDAARNRSARSLRVRVG